MQQKIVLIMVLLLASTLSSAIKDIPIPDTSQSKDYIVKKHDEILDDFNSKLNKTSGFEKGTLYGELGMFYQAHEFFIAAKVCYENAIELSQHDHRWYYLLGFLESQDDDVEKGNQYYFKTLGINNKYMPAKIRLATNEMESGNFEHASSLYNEVLKVIPDYSRALVGLGTISMQKGEFDNAINYFNRAQKLQPNASQLNYLISQAYSAKGDIIKAEKFMAIKGQQPVVMYDKVLEEMHLHSVSPAYYAHSAINAFMSKNYALAEHLVEKAISMDPNDINPKYTLLNVYLVTNRNKKARDLSKVLLQKTPNNERLYFVQGLTYDNEKNYIKAIESYKKALQINQNNKTVTLNLAEVYLLIKDFTSALKEFRIAQSQDPENSYPIYKDALILLHLKKCNDAIPKFMLAIQKQPENFEYLTGFVKAVAGCQNVKQQIRTDALNAARNMYNISPSIPVIEVLARIELFEGNKKNAIDYQAQAIFQALSQKANESVVNKLKADFDLIKKGVIPN